MRFCLFMNCRPYTYCDTPGDTSLDTFSLAEDDLLYKIPYVLMAKNKSEKEVKKQV